MIQCIDNEGHKMLIAKHKVLAIKMKKIMGRSYPWEIYAVVQNNTGTGVGEYVYPTVAFCDSQFECDKVLEKILLNEWRFVNE